MGLPLRHLAEAMSMEDAMGVFAALDVSQEGTAICVVGPDGALLVFRRAKLTPLAG